MNGPIPPETRPNIDRGPLVSSCSYRRRAESSRKSGESHSAVRTDYETQHTCRQCLYCIVFSFCSFVRMNNHHGNLHDEATVPGFELPKSPDSSYSNIYPGTEDLAKEPPLLPPQLQRTLLSNPVDTDTESPLPQPHDATINHLYIENRDAPRSVLALGVTHRFCSKFVTVVLYKPIQRRGN